MDVAVLGRKETVPDEVRALAQAKVAKLGRLTPVLERAEVRLSEDRDAPGRGARVCEVTITGHGHTLRAKAARARRCWWRWTRSSTSSSTRSSG